MERVKNVLHCAKNIQIGIRINSIFGQFSGSVNSAIH